MSDSPANTLLLEKIVDQFTAELRDGKHPAIGDYQDRHPELANEIADVLSSVAMIEQLKNGSVTRADYQLRFDSVSKLKQIGNYTVVRELGRGGMGIVFEAIHESLGRRVAIKVMPTPLVDGQKQIERFRHEAAAAARLHHTNIVSVFGVGDGDGFLYYVMDWVDGSSLSSVIAEGVTKYSSSTASTTASRDAEHFRWCAQLGAKLADALAYAHAANILHRDIKPANIVLDRKGTPWITDFGLAKDGSREINLTKTGEVIGTPQYLAPESLEGHYDVRSETYCLGLTLYELVTQRPAYANGTAASVIRAIATASPTPPRKIDASIPLDLATIIEKSVSRDADLRYQTAAEMHDDLLAFCDERSITARRPSWLESTIRWSRRNPLPAALSAISAVLLVMVAVSASVGYWATTNALHKEAEKSERLRQQQLATAVARDEAEQNLTLMKSQFERAEANVTITLDAFEEIFKSVISRGSVTTDELDIDGFREISGIASSITKQDAQFLNKLVSFYTGFAATNADNARLKTESAKAYRRVGNIYQLVAELESSIVAYQKSIELFRSMLAKAPDSKVDLLNLVQTQNELSAAYRQHGDPRTARDWNLASVELLEQSPLATTDHDLRLELARTLSVLGFNLFRAQSVGGPNAGWNPQARMEDRRNQDAHPDRQRIRFPDAVRLATPTFLREQKRELEQATQIMDELVAKAPDNDEFRAVRATCYCILATTRKNSDPKIAKSIRDQAISEFENLVAKHPQNHEYRYLLALACSLESQQASTEDIELIERSLNISAGLIEQFPSLLDYHHLHASLQVRLARHLSDADESELTEKQRRDKVWSALKTAKSSLKQLIHHTPTDRSFKPTLLAWFAQTQKVARSLREAGDNRGAQQVQQMMLELRDELRVQAN